MKKNGLMLLVLFAVVTAVSVVACKKDSVGQTYSASIKQITQDVDESAGTATITINLNEKTARAIKLNYTLTGTAILNGDYETDNESFITIPAGSTSANLVFTIHDDHILDSINTIAVQFSSDGNINFTNSEAKIIIHDNDVSHASAGLQTDLFWDAGSLVNLDLFLANHVVIVNDLVVSADMVDASSHEKGFESVTINNSAEDGDYYLMVAYQEGSRNVNFTINANGPNISNATFTDIFPATEVGYIYFYGPVNKLGSEYSRSMGFNLNPWKLKKYAGRLTQ